MSNKRLHPDLRRVEVRRRKKAGIQEDRRRAWPNRSQFSRSRQPIAKPMAKTATVIARTSSILMTTV
jgi:hypothetical protein